MSRQWCTYEGCSCEPDCSACLLANEEYRKTHTRHHAEKERSKATKSHHAEKEISKAAHPWKSSQDHWEQRREYFEKQRLKPQTEYVYCFQNMQRQNRRCCNQCYKLTEN
ncbi:Hypothetical predicted protein [Paramuricea clavata]|uniref:Uncharacterized protein n=1 Tax=Paramuricea clavata TaxID=317549 RepID=A0A7D9DCF0_PARCT|nr:Hypothetical predicted protein [Paramuricea clavata]